ncbi:thiamine pyrophosphate-dependent enzyme [Dactylosporangium sp. CA-139066]|uniref:thiamine pyrophosphate-dependent enzyme n=1 Tax=Dactylosporangium sp. CA-139066 TaxID=3239930 RepID=UPI003D9126E3
MMYRGEIASRIVTCARARGWPLFVGNGYLAREVMAMVEPGEARALPLQGGMGLAGAVAAGFVLAGASSRAVVLEGDGNHLMGWSCAQFIAFQQLPIIHVVSANGVYASTGGQTVPRRGGPQDVSACAAALGYGQGFAVESAEELEDALATATDTALPVLVYVAEDPRSVAPRRSPETSARYAAALRT